jgi:phosphatidylinositol 4-kinase
LHLVSAFNFFDIFIEKTPGGNIGFEVAPFKLTTEYVSVMGGESSSGFEKFR